MALAVRLLCVLCLASLLISPRGVIAQTQRGPESPSQLALTLAYAPVERAARAATTNQPEAVHALIDQIFAQSPLAITDPSLKERVLKTELSYRAGTHEPLSEDAIATAVNTMVAGNELPDYMRFNRGQLHLARKDIRFFVRHFAGSDPTRGELTEGLSPAEATLVVMDLLTQKILNREYRMPPEQWVAEADKRRAAAAHYMASQPSPGALFSTTVRVSIDKHPLSPPVNIDRLTSQDVHVLLDDLGFER